MSIGNDVRCALSVDENAAVTAPLLFMVASGLLVVANFAPDPAAESWDYPVAFSIQ